MNEGARCAAGDVFLFLHADCELPEEALAVIEEMIGRGLDGGAFLKTYRPALLLLRLQALVLNHLARTRNRPVTGTNAIFVRRDRFAIWGGFREVPFCEDILMWDRLLAQGKATVVGKNVVVSSRRYRRFWGIPRVAWNGLIYVLFRLGVPLAVLKRFYGG